MQSSVYAADARLEESHWWFVGRRRLFASVLEELSVPRRDPVLDIGTSAGTNLRMLREMGFVRVAGLDLSPDAIRYCAEKGHGAVRRGDVTQMPFADEAFSLVLATDIIEHVDDDLGALNEIGRVLRPGHRALITVPAFPALWGFQDEVALHKRRYRLKPLLALIRKAGLEPERFFHFNYLLFGPVWLLRRLMKIWKPSLKSEGDINTPLLNRIMGLFFALDINTAPRISPPFGISILVIVRKPIRS